MASERDDTLEEFLAAFDRRLEAAPVVERRDPKNRRAQPAGMSIDKRRATGPASGAFGYRDSKTDSKD